ncbi:aminotransferase class IV [Hymenobacter canadensis]|uniref:Aminotransferase class IV n=1 Tax=Hymenobacter canadensis TaxID=2999067 RepID=A0ABY7LRZ3_9BACT|nr:aminotransferase class IV [Hymenobacter canadensis]WBA43190.1 aminotransferase class IV [Hymenobacter canadensis]
MMVLFNGELLPADAVRLPLPNRGLYFNDGFFETLVWEPAGLRYLPYHLARMQRAAAALGLHLPAALATGATLTATVRQLAATAQEPLQRIRLQLWRSGGGLYAPATADAEWLVTSQPFTATETPILRCDFAETVRTHASPVSFCKGPNALTYVLAARERQQRGLEELILLSGDGYVAETVAAAIGWIWQGAVYVPAEAAGGVAGTRLAHLRAVAATLGLPWHEGLYEPAGLLQAEAVFTANIAGIRPVQAVAGHLFNSETHPVLRQLQVAERTSG